MSQEVYPVPEGFRIGPRELAELNDLARADPKAFGDGIDLLAHSPWPMSITKR